MVHLHDVELERERCIITAMHHGGRPVPPAFVRHPLSAALAFLEGRSEGRLVSFVQFALWSPLDLAPLLLPKGLLLRVHVLWAAEKDAAELRDDLHSSLKLAVLVLVVDPCPGSGILFEVGVLFHGLHNRQGLPEDDELLVVGVVVRGVHRCQNNSQRGLQLSLPLWGIRHHLDVVSPHWLVLCEVEGCPRSSTILLNKGLSHVPRLEGEHRHCREKGALWYSCGLRRQYIQILCRGVVVLEKTSHLQKSRHCRDLL